MFFEKVCVVSFLIDALCGGAPYISPLSQLAPLMSDFSNGKEVKPMSDRLMIQRSIVGVGRHRCQ